LCRLEWPSHFSECITAHSSAQHSVIEISLANGIYRVNLIAAIACLIVSTNGSNVHRVVISYVSAVNSEAVAGDVSSVVVTSQHKLRILAWAKSIVCGSQAD
jgi:hypothetical protein